MPKRIVILDPNGVEVANRVEGDDTDNPDDSTWQWIVGDALEDLQDALKPMFAGQSPKLGTYTVTVKEVG